MCFVSELPGPSTGPPGLGDLAGRQEQDEPPQPRHLLLPRVDVGHQRPPRPRVGALHRAAAPDPKVSDRDLAQEPGRPVTKSA